LQNISKIKSPAFLLVILLLTAFYTTNAQTIFSPGDIAIVGIATNIGDDDITAYCETGGISGRDRISIVTFKDITTGTKFDITDNGWERAFAGMWGNKEGFLRITRIGGTIPAGTVMTFELSKTGGPPPICISPDNNWGFTQSGNKSVNLGSFGDQLFLLQGGVWDGGTGCPTLCNNDAIYSGGTVLWGTSTTPWTLSAPGTVNTIYNSRLPVELGNCFNMVLPSNYISYQTPISPANREIWLDRILNISNWTNFLNCPSYSNPPSNLSLVQSTAFLSCMGGCNGCAPLTTSLKVNFTLPASWGPFSIVISNGSTNTTFNNIIDGQVLNLVTNTNSIYSIVSISAANGCLNNLSFGTPVIVTVLPSPQINNYNGTICEGNVLNLNTLSYTGSNIAGSSLSFYTALPPAPGNQIPSGITTVNNSAIYYGVAISPNGCRDTFPVNITVNQLPDFISVPIAPTCEGGMDGLIVVSPTMGTPPYLYNIGAGNQTNNLFNNLGAGSYQVTVTDNYLCTQSATVVVAPGIPPDTTNITTTTCIPAQAGVFMQQLTNVAGCDSLIITTIALVSSDTTFLSSTNCDPSQSGISQVLLTGTFGCDSLVITNTSLLPGDTTYLTGTSCNPGQTGTFTQTLSNSLGCDSLVITTIALVSSDTTFLSATNCDPSQTGISQVLLTGTFGCDSLVITNTTLLPGDTTYLMGTSCNPAQTGTFTQTLSNSFGCDSLIITTISLVSSDTTYLSATNCDPSQTGISQVLLTGTFGCDSLVITNTTLLPGDTTYLMGTSCNPAQTGTFTQTLSNSFGCDSLIITTISLVSSDTTYLSASNCDPSQTGITEVLLTGTTGCDSLVITNTTLLPGDTTYLTGTSCNPAQTGTFIQTLSNSLGCDSLIITTVSLISSDTTFLSATNCDPSQTGISQVLLTGTFGCDSLVITNTNLLPGDTTYLTGTSCDPAQTGTFTQTLSNSFGCDSLVITTISLVIADTTFLSATNCDPSQTGISQVLLTGTFGCDSLVITNTTLLPGDTTYLTGTSCDPAQTGTFTQTLSNSFGCDSLVITTISLASADTTFLSASNCDPSQTGISEVLLTGTFGCDSLVITNTTLLPGDTTYLMGTSCNPAQTGTFTQTLSNSFGCDSLVITTISLVIADTTFLSATNCDPSQTGISQVLLTGTFGCDSLVITNTTLLPGDTTYLTGTSCDPAQTGTFTQTLSNSFGCDSLVITTISLASADTTFLSASNCDPSQTGISEVLLTGTFGCDSLVITNTTLLPGDTTYLAGTSCDPAQTGTFTQTLSNSFGCDSLIITNIAYEELTLSLGEDLNILLGDSVQLEPVLNFYPDSISWQSVSSVSCSDCLDPYTQPLQTSFYQLTAWNSDGCIATDDVVVFVDNQADFFAPNIFSPNGDGINDNWLLFTGNSIEQIVDLHIFDRWGECVYLAQNILPNDSNSGWDGRYHGQEVNPEIYVYFATIRYINGREQIVKGDFTLIK
jgi:gliding motility-associated-like protein